MKHFFYQLRCNFVVIKSNGMHRGEWIKDQIKDRGYSLDILAEQLQIARTTLWRMTKAEDLPFYKMKLIADGIGIDLRSTFPETVSMYERKEKDYRSLYQKSLEEIAELREDLEKYKALDEKNRDKNGTEAH